MSQRDWADKDLYKILGVAPNASKDDIKKAYRKLAQKFHPDANKGDAAAEARFKEISEAHSILSNDEKRKEYDHIRAFVQSGGQRFYGFGPERGGNVRVNIGDLGDLFGGSGDAGDVFGDFFGFGRRDRRGSDVETEARLSFQDAVHGATVSIAGGTKVRIPPGVRDGARIRVPGKGRAGAGGSPPGDLYVRVSVELHPLFVQEKDGDLALTLPVTFVEAALGAEVQVPTLEGEVTVKIPPGTSNGKVLRVKGRGGPRPRGGNGDLLVRVTVEVPKKLTKQERELLTQFAEVHKASPREHLAEFVNRRKAS